LTPFEASYDGMKYLLVVKEEWSGKLWSVPIKTRDQIEVGDNLMRFEAFVSWHYGVQICIFRSDNEAAVITPDEYRSA
jgi:hypothetical protein